jgi:polysaccharide export outer membrane protein
MTFPQRCHRPAAASRRRRWSAAVSLGVALMLATLGCARTRPPAPFEPPLTGPYRLHPGDVLEVKFLYHPTETQRLTIRPDGTLPLSITGDLDVNGLSVDESEDLIRARASRYLRDPVVSVTVVESGARAYVGGEVESPGFVSLAKPMSAIQAILERGGFGRGADMTRVNIISIVDGKPIQRELNLRRDSNDGMPITESLSPDDVVFVPKTGIAAANAWVEQWLDGLTPQIFKSFRAPAF